MLADRTYFSRYSGLWWSGWRWRQTIRMSVVRRSLVFPTQTIYFVAGNAGAAVRAHDTRALEGRDGILRTLSSLQSRTSEKAHSVEDPREIAHVPPLKKEEYPEFWPFWYSLELATPLPSLGQEDHWDIEGVWFLEFYKIFHVIFGWLLCFLIVVSPTKLLRRD